MKKLFATCVILTITGLAAYGQHSGGGGQMHQHTQQGMSQQMMASMNQQMQNMEQMMQHSQEMMKRTSNMVNAMHGHNQGSGQSAEMHGGMMAGGEKSGMPGGSTGMMQGQGGQSMMNMMHDIDGIARNMNDMMQQMQQIMSDQTMMNDPGMQSHMQEMQKNMKEFMNGFDKVVGSAERMQKEQKK